MNVHSESERGPDLGPDERVLAVEAWRRAEAMGLVAGAEPRLDRPGIARLLRSVRNAGIGKAPALRFDNVEVPSSQEVLAVLELLIIALEQSPVSRFEWPSVSRVLDAEALASLLGISLSSLRRYLTGARETPDEVAARLHFLALVVGDLAGAYNEVGVRRWFERPRTALGGKTPASLLTGEWDPDDPGPQKVRALARALVTLSAT
jgi:hypothetical protein